MRFAYADPPYEGQASKYAREARAHNRRSAEVDHPALVAELLEGFPDGWALSMKTGSLRSLLPLCPPSARVAAWVKPFVPAYRGVRPVYSWEPVVVVGGRAPQRELIVRDSLVFSNRQGLMPRKHRWAQSRQSFVAGFWTCSAIKTGTSWWTCSPARESWVVSRRKAGSSDA